MTKTKITMEVVGSLNPEEIDITAIEVGGKVHIAKVTSVAHVNDFGDEIHQAMDIALKTKHDILKALKFAELYGVGPATLEKIITQPPPNHSLQSVDLQSVLEKLSNFSEDSASDTNAKDGDSKSVISQWSQKEPLPALEDINIPPISSEDKEFITNKVGEWMGGKDT